VLVILALPTGEAAPHSFGGFVEAGVIVLASKIAQSPSLFAEHRVLTSPATFMHCDQLTHAIHHLPWHSCSTSLTHHSGKTVPLCMSPGLGTAKRANKRKESQSELIDRSNSYAGKPPQIRTDFAVGHQLPQLESPVGLVGIRTTPLDVLRLSIGLSLTADLPGAIPQANIIIALTGNFQGVL
jgi:hypothetical protein